MLTRAVLGAASHIAGYIVSMWSMTMNAIMSASILPSGFGTRRNALFRAVQCERRLATARHPGQVLVSNGIVLSSASSAHRARASRSASVIFGAMRTMRSMFSMYGCRAWDVPIDPQTAAQGKEAVTAGFMAWKEGGRKASDPVAGCKRSTSTSPFERQRTAASEQGCRPHSGCSQPTCAGRWVTGHRRGLNEQGCP